MWFGPTYYLSIFVLFFIMISIFFLNFSFSIHSKFLIIKKNINFFLFSAVVLMTFSINWLYLIFLTPNELNLYFNLISVYSFPFMFIFLFITVVSIIFCLSYNQNETSLFLFYCVSILIIGFNLFLTNDLIFFFYYMRCF
jgi:hypothetical protein